MKGRIVLLTKDLKLIKETEHSLPENVELSTYDEVEKAYGADIVLLDVDSLGIGGLSRFRNESFLIIITAQKGARYLIESMTFGAFDCIFKPLKNSTLIEPVHRALGIKSELQRNLIKFPGEVEG